MTETGEDRSSFLSGALCDRKSVIVLLVTLFLQAALGGGGVALHLRKVVCPWLCPCWRLTQEKKEQEPCLLFPKAQRAQCDTWKYK